MTVSMQVNKRIYAGNGVTREWDVDFPFASPGDVHVYVTSPAGAETELTADFELNSAGTLLTYPTLASGKPPLPAGWSITLVRQTPLTQEIDLVRQGELDAEVLEDGYDKLTFMVQELDEKVSRSIKYPVSVHVSDQETDTFLQNILAIKQDTLNASAAAVSSAQAAQQSASSAQQTAQNALTAISASLAQAQEEISTSGAEAEEALLPYVSAAHEDAETARYYAERSIGKTVGEVYYSQSAAEADNPGALPLFTGETIASAGTLYPDFFAWVSAHEDLQCTAADYEAALEEFGECPKYVIGETSLRLPLLKGFVKNGNAVSQGIFSGGFLGVPDFDAGYTITSGSALTEDALITAEASPGGYNTITLAVDGKNVWAGGVSENTGRYRAGNVYAPKGSVITSNAAAITVYPLCPRAGEIYTQLYPWVCAYNAAVPASTVQASQFQQALSGKVDLPSGVTQVQADLVVDAYREEDGNWYRVYKSGWVEQGGVTSKIADYGTLTVTLLKPYLDANYTVSWGVWRSGLTDDAQYNSNVVGNNTTKTSSSFQLYNRGNADGGRLVSWIACGQGE